MIRTVGGVLHGAILRTDDVDVWIPRDQIPAIVAALARVANHDARTGVLTIELDPVASILPTQDHAVDCDCVVCVNRIDRLAKTDA